MVALAFDHQFKKRLRHFAVFFSFDWVLVLVLRVPPYMFSVCVFVCVSDVNKDLTLKDKDKDKDQTLKAKDQDKD